MAAALIILVRLVLPLSIFRYPLVGGILALLADTYDILVLGYATHGHFTGVNEYVNANYQWIDKLLDLYYITFELIVARRLFDPLAQRVMSWLYVWRLAGFVVFEVTGLRSALFFAPNLVEYWYLVYLCLKKASAEWRLTPRNAAIIIVLLLAIKLPHEYLLHVKQVGVWPYLSSTVPEHVRTLY